MGTNEDNSVTSVIIKTCAPVDVQEFERSASKFDNSELLLIYFFDWKILLSKPKMGKYWQC